MPREDRVLAEGEVTGHAHVAVAENVKLFGTDVKREMSAPTGTDIVHEEHKRMPIPAGDFEIDRQQEIDPDEQEARTVRD